MPDQTYYYMHHKSPDNHLTTPTARIIKARFLSSGTVDIQNLKDHVLVVLGGEEIGGPGCVVGVRRFVFLLEQFFPLLCLGIGCGCVSLLFVCDL